MSLHPKFAMSSNKHPNYKILNLIGYGLAKFDSTFVKAFGFSSKSELYNHCVQIGVADTSGTVKNRQDMFDPFFDNKRKGWWQRKDAYVHRKIYIDSLFGELDVYSYVNFLKAYLANQFPEYDVKKGITPITRSIFKKLQQTGLEAELFFIQRYQSVALFKNGILKDARLLGDGYDFQIQTGGHFYLSEVKGVVKSVGSIRLTKKEHEQAQEHKMRYVLSVVSNLEQSPKITVIQDPANCLNLKKQVLEQKQVSYHCDARAW